MPLFLVICFRPQPSRNGLGKWPRGEGEDGGGRRGSGNVWPRAASDRASERVHSPNPTHEEHIRILHHQLVTTHQHLTLPSPPSDHPPLVIFWPESEV